MTPPGGLTGLDQWLPGKFYDRGGAVINARHPDFGAVGDGVTDDTVALQAAIDAARSEKLPLMLNGAFGVSSRIVFNTGEGVAFTQEPFHQIVEATTTGIIPLASFSDPDNIVVEIQEAVRFIFGTLVVNNRVNRKASLVGVLCHNSNSGLTLGGRGVFGRIAVSGCEVAMRVGDFAGDTYHSNFEGFHVDELAAYECGTILHVNSNAIDLITFRTIRSSGDGLRADNTTANKIYIQRCGNGLNLGRVFVNADDVIDNNAVVRGDTAFNFDLLSIEGGDHPLRAVDLIDANGAREVCELRNVYMVKDQCVDDSGYSAKVGYGPGCHLQNWSSVGRILLTEKTTYNNVVFQSTAPVGHPAAAQWPGRFELSGARATITGKGHYSRASASSGSSTLRADEYGRFRVQEHWDRNTLPDRARGLEFLKNEGSANLLDNTDYSILTITLPNSACFGVILDYFMFDATGAQVFSSAGRIKYAGSIDSTGNVTNATPQLDTPAQALDGYSTLTVTASQTNVGNVITLKIKQNNDLDVPARCVFKFEYFAAEGSVAAVDEADINLAP